MSGSGAHILMLTHQLSCPLLIGREAELEALGALLERVVAGQGQMVFVTGDAGIGKSRLCRDLRQRAADRGLRVLVGRCGAQSALPYGPFMDALRFRLAKGEREEAARVLGPLASRLARLLPELRREADSRASDPDEFAPPPTHPFESIFEAFERLAELGPFVLVLEDLQYADATSRELLHFLAHRIQTLPLMIVGTARSDELHTRHPLRRLIASLTVERLGREIVLVPLTEDGVGRMIAAIVGSEPSPSFVEAVTSRSDGNPFFVEELLKGLADRDQLQADAHADAAEIHLPRTLREIVLARLEPLGEHAFSVLSTAAVIGRRFDFDVLQRVTGLEEEALLGIIEQLVEHQVLVEERGSGEWFAFRHALTQEVLYRSLVARRRRLLHRQVAAVLETRPSTGLELSREAIAFHYRAGGDAERARPHAVLAGDQALRLSAWRDAESWYERALESADGRKPDQALEAQVMEKLAYVSWWQGRAEFALSYTEKALALRRALGEPRALSAALRHAGLLHGYHRGDWARGIVLVRESLAVLEPAPEGPETARAANDLGRLLIGAAELDDAARWLGYGLTVARRLDKPVEEALALAELGYVAVMRGQVAVGSSWLESARERIQCQRLPLDRATGIYYAGVLALEVAHENDRARVWIGAATEYCERHGMAANQAINDALRASLDCRKGTGTADALELAESAVDALRAAQRVEVRDALRVLGDIYRLRGDVVSAGDAYSEAARLGDRTSEAGIALSLLASGRAGDAAHRLEVLAKSIDADQHLVRIHFLAPAIEASVAASRFAEAFEMLDLLQHHVDESDSRAAAAMLASVAGRVAAASGDVSAAIMHLERAASGWSSLGEPLEQARAVAELARILISTDRDVPGGSSLGRDATRTLDAIGATAEAGRVRRMLRRVGIRVRSRPLSAPPATEAAPYGLTTRETEVLRELVAGGTNKEIAAALGISEKTASIHVSHILAKLECATRTQAAGMALAQGLLR
ncbi:MAG: helix-turn-helix transcriptional regulator [Gemmatimonadaceae bacterium]